MGFCLSKLLSSSFINGGTQYALPLYKLKGNFIKSINSLLETASFMVIIIALRLWYYPFLVFLALFLAFRSESPESILIRTSLYLAS